jgi:hypothetical protein
MPRQLRWAIKQDLDGMVDRLYKISEKLEKYRQLYAGDGSKRSQDFYNLEIKVYSLIQKLIELRNQI